MIDKLTFLNDAWSLPVLLVAAVLLLVFIWKEWHQFLSARFYLKVVVAFLGICSLVMIALKPALLNAKNSRDLILLTEAYKKSTLDSLKKKHKKIKIITYNENNSELKDIKNADSIFILGNGIKTYDLWQLDGKPIKFFVGTPLTGITKFKYKQEQSIGDKAIFQGLYESTDLNAKLLLEGPGGGTLDSISLKGTKEKAFRLSVDLKSAGNFVYTLVEKDSVGTIKSSNPIPVVVREKENLKILIINGFPTFETKYLKNFLAEMDHEVVVRSQVTNGKFKYEYFNTKQSAIGNITGKFLESYDLLIIDYNSVITLSTSEKNALESSIREYGLGVFIQPEAALFRSISGLASFDFIQDYYEEATIQENLKLTKYPFSFKQSLSLQPIQSSDEQIFSAYKRIGQGKVGSSVLQNTYELLLDGNTLAYQQLWTKLINNISKKEIPLVEWYSDIKMGIPDEPYQFQMRTLETAPIVLTEEGAVIPLRQDIDIPSLWTGISYPKSAGWQHLSLQQDTAQRFNYYVTAPKKWKSLRANGNIQENKRYSSLAGSTTRKILDLTPVNPIYFYLVFLFCMGYLWLEPKIRSY